MILLRVMILVAAYGILCIPAGHASYKLYDMGIFLHKSMDRPDSVAVQVGLVCPLKCGTITSPLTSSESESKFNLAPTVQRGTPIARRLPAARPAFAVADFRRHTAFVAPAADRIFPVAAESWCNRRARIWACADPSAERLGARPARQR